MKFLSLLALPFAATAVNAIAASVAYDTVYDSAAQSTLVTSCSDGINGLYTKGYPTLGSLPTFPRVGAASTVAGWNSPNCGKCYRITWNGKSINVIAVDHAASGFVLSRAAMDQLTGGLATQLGRINADYTEVPASNCGMK